MKKIIFTIYLMVFIIFAFFLRDFFIEYESYRYTAYNIFQLSEYDKLYSSSQEEIINILKKISQEEKVNIYQFNHERKKDGTELSIYYYALGDKELYDKKFDCIKGITKTFNPYNEIYSLPIEECTDKQLRTHLFIEGKNKLYIENAVNRLTTQKIDFEHFELYKNNLFNMLRILLYSGAFKSIFLMLIIMIPTTFYFYYIKLNEIYVKKSLGFSNRRTKVELLKDVLIIQASSVVLSILLQIIYLNRYDKIFNYLFFAIFSYIILLMFIFIFDVLTIYMINFNKIEAGLKYRKPYFKMAILGKLFSVLATVLLLYTVLNGFAQYKEIKLALKDVAKWEKLKNYQDFNFGYIDQFPTQDKVINELESSKKAQELYRICEEKGGILLNFSLYSDLVTNAKNKILITNANYIYLEEIKDIYGNNIKDINPDKLTILVPLKYKGYEHEVKEVIEKRILDLRFYIEEIYMKSKNTTLVLESDIEFEIKYIKDNQKAFLYTKIKDFMGNNYATNSIFVCVNSDIIGKSVCLAEMTKTNFKAYVGDSSFDTVDLNTSIRSLSASNMIKIYNSYDNNLAVNIMEMHRVLKSYEQIGLILLIIQICVSMTNIYIYHENFKQIHCIKKISGYSFLRRHGMYILMLVLEVLILISIYSNWINKLNITKIYMYPLVIVLFNIYLLKSIEKKSITGILKRS